jgi:hypothetical protein
MRLVRLGIRFLNRVLTAAASASRPESGGQWLSEKNHCSSSKLKKILLTSGIFFLFSIYSPALFAQTLSVTPSSGPKSGTVFTYDGNGYTPNGTIRRFLKFPGAGSFTEISSITANSSGHGHTTYTASCSDQTGIYTEFWVNAANNQQSNQVQVTETDTAACNPNPPTLSVSPTSGSKNGTVFTYDGDNYTPNGTINRTLTFPDGHTQQISSITANSSGHGHATFTASCADQTGTYVERWTDAATGRQSNTVTVVENDSPACNPVTLSVNPTSGPQAGTVFTYDGNNYTPNGTIRRFLTFPDGHSQEISSITANASGHGHTTFTASCADQVGTYTEHWVDAATNRNSNNVQVTETASQVCSTPTLSVNPASGPKNGTVFTYDGDNYTPNGTITRSLTFPDGHTQQLASITANASGHGRNTYTASCADQTGAYIERWTDAATGRQSNTVTVVENDSPACLTPTLSVNPQSGSQNGAVFTYDGDNYTPNGTINRFLQFPDGHTQQISSITANSSGHGHATFTASCADQAGTYTEHWVDAATNRNSNNVQVTETASSVCATPTLSVSPASGSKNGTVFTYDGDNYTPNGTITRSLTFPDGHTQQLASITANASGHGHTTYTASCADQVGTYVERWTDTATGRQSNTVTVVENDSPACLAAPTLSVSPQSGPQLTTTFTYDGNNYTPNGVVRRTLTFPDGHTQDISSITADASGHAHTTFTTSCSDQVGAYVEKWTDIATGRQSNTVSVTETASAGCNPVTLSVSPTSGSKNGAVFTYDGDGYTPNGTINRTLTFPDGHTQQIGSITANSSGHGHATFTASCSDQTGLYVERWTDAATGRQSNQVQVTENDSPQCSNPAAAPIITGIDPQVPIATGDDQPIVVRGNNFLPNLSVSLFLNGSVVGTLSGQQIRNVTPASFTMIISFNRNPGNYSIRVKNTDNRESNLFPFTVQPLAEDKAAFVGETIRDDDPPMPAGQSFTKTWTIRNSGTTTWDSRYKLRWVSGSNLSNHADVALVGSVAPGSNYTFSIPMTAPTNPDTYRENWQFVSPSGATIAVDSSQIVWVIIKVGTTCNVPSITSHPSSQSLTRGQRVTLTVVSNGTSFQWYSGARGDTSTPIPGAISNSYTTMPLFNNSLYWVRVGNSCGTVDSTAAVLTVGEAQPSSLEITGIEVTQAIQDLENRIPLIKDKRTFVRVHVKSSFGTVSGVTAELIGRRNGVLLPESPISPINSPEILERPSRARRDQSFLFEMPAGWRSGTITLDFRGISRSFGCSALSHGDCSLATVSFIEAQPASVRLVRVVWEEEGNKHIPKASDIRSAVEQIEATFPIPRLDWDDVYLTEPISGQPSTGDDFVKILSKLQHRRSVDCTSSVSNCKDHYMGILVNPPTAGRYVSGRVDNIPGSVGAGYVAAGFTIPHEFAHEFGRSHTACGGATGTDPDYPNPDATISSDKSDRGFFGFNIFDIDQSGIYGPHTFDIMSYCSPNWISAYNYMGLLSDFSGSGQSLAPQETASRIEILAAGQPVAVFSGSVSVTQGTGGIERINTLESAISTSVSNQGAYAIKYENAQGQSLATYSFEPETVSEDTTGLFSLVLPWNSATTRVVLLHNGQEIDSRRASTSAPRVTMIYPNSGELLTGSTATLRWSASDADGDQLTYVILYSSDSGSNWNTLVTDYPSTSFELDLSAIAGTDQGLIRVLASDGFFTSADQSDNTFKISKHAPQVTIAPLEKNQFLKSENIVLQGRAFDNEDGPLGDEKLTWRSNLNGNLGQGGSLIISAASLSPGTHNITLTALDRDGQSSSATIVLTVSHKELPKITNVTVNKKKLLVAGENFDNGAVIFLNGERQKTANDDQNPDLSLIGKKAGKKVGSGQTVTVMVKNSDGTLSNAFSFTRP